MEKIKEVVISFFKKRNALIEIYKDYLVLDKVDKEFEKVHGKKSPYKVLFEGEKEGFESLEQGSKFLESVMKILEKDTTNTILKINLKADPLKEIENKISLKNCFLRKINKSYENNFFSRFTFKTTFRYLNKTEEIVSELFVHEKKIVKGNLEDYEICEGELDKVDSSYMREDYEIAKKSIKDLMRPNIDNIGGEISELVRKEVERIGEHYKTQREELETKANKNKLKIEELKKDERNLEKIKKLESAEFVKNIEEEIEKINKEEEFSIRDVKQKYAVNMETKLENSTVIYYPVYRISLLLEDGNVRKDFEIKYDPLLDKISGTNCFSCGIELKEVSICSSGHLCCSNCLFRCSSCGKQFCKECLKNQCKSCGGPICNDCVRICKKCRRVFCKEHIRESSVSKEEYCSDCIDFCSECFRGFPSEELTKISEDRKLCVKCLANLKKKNILEDIFSQ